LGFIETHRKGSQVKMKHEDGRVIVFPFHDEVDRHTLKGALRDASVEIGISSKRLNRPAQPNNSFNPTPRRRGFQDASFDVN